MNWFYQSKLCLKFQAVSISEEAGGARLLRLRGANRIVFYT